MMPPAAGGRFADDPQLYWRLCRIFCHNRKPVHLRTVERRQICIRDDIFRQHAANNYGQVDVFGAEHDSFALDDFDGL